MIAGVRQHILVFGVLLSGGGIAAADDIPLPRERPAEPVVTAAEMAPSLCRQRLETIAQITALPDRIGPGACGGTDMVRLDAIRLVDGSTVKVTPAAELRCEMAAQVADWIREDAAPTFAPARLVAIGNYDSYDCRGRNRVAVAKVSEHGKGNALDVRSFALAGGRMVSPVDTAVAHDLREALRQSACARFTTVLGPGSDGFHEQHIHVDMADRHNGYRICHWDLRDKPVEVARAAIPLPRERPVAAGQTAHAE
jgi:hypothetical protein